MEERNLELVVNNDAVENAAEFAEQAGGLSTFAKVGIGLGVTGVALGLGFLVYKGVKNYKAKKAAEAEVAEEVEETEE